MNADINTLLQQELHALASQRHVHHALLGVSHLHGDLHWLGATGTANAQGEPASIHTPFHIASIDKLMTATLVMQRVEQGLLDLDAPLETCLPQTLIRGLPPLTLRHLLSHTSGLPDCYEERPAQGLSLMERVFQGELTEWTLEQVMDQVRQMKPHFAPRNPRQPGQWARYCNTGYELMNWLIEDLSQQPLHQCLQQDIFIPAGMAHSWQFGRMAAPQDSLPPADIWIDDQPLQNQVALEHFTSIYCTLDDLICFIKALVQGQLFQYPDTLPQMLQTCHKFGFPLDRVALRAPGWPIQVGLGLQSFCVPRLFTPFHSIPEVIGHTGSTSSWAFYCPERQLVICGCVNQTRAAALPYQRVPGLLKKLKIVSPDA